MKVKASIKAYGQEIFKSLRKKQNIEEQDIIESIDPVNNVHQIFKVQQQTRFSTSTNIGGNSGSFFFFTDDQKFIVKTITLSELRVLENILQSLYDHYC